MIILRDDCFLYASLSANPVLPVPFTTSYEADTIGHDFTGTVASALATPSSTRLTDTITGTGIVRIKYVTIYNPNVASITVTIKTVDEDVSPPTTTSELSFTLNSGDSLFYEEEYGWYVLNSSGARKVTGVGAAVASINISAGTTSNNLNSLVFSNLNGVTFGLNGSTITGSVAVGLTNLRVSAGTTSNLLSAITFSNSNGIAFGINASVLTASYTVPTLTNSSWSVSAGTSSQTVGNLVFSNSNGLAFGLSGSTITGSYTVPTLTNSSWTLSAGTSSMSVNSLVFSNSNGISFGLSGSTITGSHNALTSQSNQALSAANGSFTFQTATFANSNGVSFSTGTQGIFASVADPTPLTLSFVEYPVGAIAGLHAAVNNIVSVQPLVLYQALTATVADLFFSVSLTTSAANNTTYSGTLNMNVGIYSLNAGTLSLASSGSQSYSYSYTSNVSTAVLSGVRKFTIPINVNATKGNWWYGLIWSFAAGSGSITNSIIGASNQGVGNYSGMWGATGNVSNQFVPYTGIYSVVSAALPTAMSVSEIHAGAGNATQNEARPTYIILRNISTAV